MEDVTGGRVAQEAVGTYGWLAPGEMLDGLGMAETTPGPLIMVTQYAGFLAAWNLPGGLSPLMAGTLGALVTTYVTFLPCFFFIFAGAPFIEAMSGNQRLQAAQPPYDRRAADSDTTTDPNPA